MIVVRVELHSAITREVTELARMHIANDGTGTATRCNYHAAVFRGRSREALDKQQIQRSGAIADWPRQQLHVWNLVATLLAAMGYQR